MPEISRFLGIVIAMFYRDHVPAHFHAMYGDYEITVTIETGIVTGRFPRRALRHVLEWYELHKQAHERVVLFNTGSGLMTCWKIGSVPRHGGLYRR